MIETGDFVTLDFGAYYKGYCSDITRTIAVGEPSDKLKEIYNIVLEAQLRGVNGIKAGLTGREADALTRDYITEKDTVNTSDILLVMESVLKSMKHQV